MCVMRPSIKYVTHCWPIFKPRRYFRGKTVVALHTLWTAPISVLEILEKRTNS
jgi:hypothetical protein